MVFSLVLLGFQKKKMILVYIFFLIYFVSLNDAAMILKDNASDNWITCGHLSNELNHTACPNTATCCQNKWNVIEDSWGCVDLYKANCCDNGYTACPNGFKCVDKKGSQDWQVTTACVPIETQTCNSTGLPVCKTGPTEPFSTTLKNMIVMGDSVSIGYTPFLQQQLSSMVNIQHAPGDLIDGGVGDVQYGDQCLDYFLRAPNGTLQIPDLILFNWGLHDLGNKSMPGQEEPFIQYAPYLDALTYKLSTYAKNNNVQLLFALTTPWLNNVTLNDNVQKINQKAIEIMKKFNIEIIDLYTPIINKCGPVPKNECFDIEECWSPHCPNAGYEWLAANVITPKLKKIFYYS